MPALALPPQALPAIVRQAEEWFGYASGSYGHEASQLHGIMTDALSHLFETARAQIESADDLETDSPEIPPASRIFHVTTRYVYAGKGTPLPFDLDDE